MTLGFKPVCSLNKISSFLAQWESIICKHDARKMHWAGFFFQKTNTVNKTCQLQPEKDAGIWWVMGLHKTRTVWNLKETGICKVWNIVNRQIWGIPLSLKNTLKSFSIIIVAHIHLNFNRPSSSKFYSLPLKIGKESNLGLSSLKFTM